MITILVSVCATVYSDNELCMCGMHLVVGRWFSVVGLGSLETNQLVVHLFLCHLILIPFYSAANDGLE